MKKILIRMLREKKTEEREQQMHDFSEDDKFEVVGID